MSNKFKSEISNHLRKAVADRFPASAFVGCVETESGLYCDFDLPEPLDPEMFKALSEEMAGAVSGGRPFELSHFSGVYTGGNADGKVLQRIYVIAYENESDFEAYKRSVKEAAERDHRVLGPKMGIYSSSDEIGAGLILWHPKGAMLRYLLEQFAQSAHILNGYQWVYSPHIGKAALWETSGHLGFYRDSMYSPISIDGEDYYLKPMNCPFHIDIYNSTPHSYRDLPVKYAEFGTVYRYELSGTLSGLSRVRGFTQDDAHIICTPDQLEGEVMAALKFSLYVLQSFGLTDFKAYISTKPKVKFIGREEDWKNAEAILKQVAAGAGLDHEIDEGGGAFYGPKIDIKLKDLLGREWQCSTIQFDFNLPERFKMTYTGRDGAAHTPFMIHRALFGSIERFTALLVEHYAGDFPLWFAPVQIGIVPVAARHNDYCRRTEAELKKLGLRVACDHEDVHMREKIKRYETEKIPIMLIIGDREAASGGFSVRSRKGANLGAMDICGLMDLIGPELEKGKPRYIVDD